MYAASADAARMAYAAFERAWAKPCPGVATSLHQGGEELLTVSGQIKLRRIDGWRRIAAVLSRQNAVAA